MKKTLIRGMAWCTNCSWQIEDMPRCGRSGAAHAKKHGHEVNIELSYGYKIGEFKVDKNQSTVFDAIVGGKEVGVLIGRGEHCTCGDCPVLYGGECPTTAEFNKRVNGKF